MNRHISRALLLAALAASGGCRRAAAAREPAPAALPSVRSLLVEERPMPRTLRLAGTLTASQEAAVAAGVAGKVLATFVERGSYVRKGDPLARLDARLSSAAAREAQAQLASARVQRELARADCQRNRDLFDSQAISRAEYDRVQAGCKVAQHGASAAEARNDTTATLLHDSTIRAPFAGVVAERSVSAGEYVRADSRVLTLVAVDPLRLELTVPEAYVPEVRPDTALTFHLTAGPTAPAQRAVVRYVGPVLRRQSRDLVVEAVVENADRKLRPGMFALAELPLGDLAVPAVPRPAVRSEGGLHRVFVVTGHDLEERLVQLGAERDGLVAVVRGLARGERVAALATPELRDGLRIASSR